MTEAYPLQWPAHRPRTRYPERSKFKAPTFTVVCRELFAELDRLGARNSVLSTNIPLRNDGMPYGRYSVPSDKGIAVYFEHKKKQMCFACDRWDAIEDNVRAVQRTIEALRGIERWGSGDMLEAAFTGFQALPAPSSAVKDWWQVLFVRRGAPLTEIEKAYRDMARLAHPDNGGSDEQMAELNAAIAAARKEYQG